MTLAAMRDFRVASEAFLGGEVSLDLSLGGRRREAEGAGAEGAAAGRTAETDGAVADGGAGGGEGDFSESSETQWSDSIGAVLVRRGPAAAFCFFYGVSLFWKSLSLQFTKQIRASRPIKSEAHS